MARFEFAERGYQTLPTVEAGAPKLEVALNLPEYVNTDQIGVNVRRIHQMMRLGGISSLQVVGTSGEVSAATPSLVGHTPDGAGLAGTSAIVKKVPTSVSSRGEQDDEYEPDYIAGRWVDAKVIVNLAEIQDRMQAKKEPLRSTKAWSRELNSAITKGIVEEGVKHVSLDMRLTDYLSVALATSLGTWGGSGSVAGVIGENLYYHTMYNLIDRFSYHRRGYETGGFRWSLFAGPQLDRALLLKVMAETGKVVKPLPDEQ